MSRTRTRIAALARHVGASPRPVAAGEAPAPKKMLEGIRVVELATVVAAPAAAAALADLGAEVIKVESPSAPDVTRSWGNGDEASRTASPELGNGSGFTQCDACPSSGRPFFGRERALTFWWPRAGSTGASRA